MEREWGEEEGVGLQGFLTIPRVMNELCGSASLFGNVVFPSLATQQLQGRQAARDIMSQQGHVFTTKKKAFNIAQLTSVIAKTDVNESVRRFNPGLYCCFSFCLSSCLSQTGLRFCDCNHIVEFAFVEFVSALPSKDQVWNKASSMTFSGVNGWFLNILAFLWYQMEKDRASHRNSHLLLGYHLLLLIGVAAEAV
ncbi:hypothetical protein GmHk_09G026123 [Glycine max]|nr:hypothetical protein GmHk_09G026123 [Glycine max]